MMLLTPLLAAVTASVIAADSKITIQVDKPGHSVAPGLFGIFFEDINLSADGGLYPELVRNRSFEDAETPQYWKLVSMAAAEISTDTSKPLNPLNRHSLRVKLDGGAQLVNDGCWGMNFVKGDGYVLKFAARAADGFDGSVSVKLLGADNRELATGKVSGITREWSYGTAELIAAGGNDNTQHTIGPDAAKHSIPGSIETGRWYDVRLEIRGNTVKGWLDGKLVQEVDSLRPPIKSLSASVTRDEKSGEIIVKVVNGADSPLETEIDLQGAGQLSAAGKAIVLTSDRATDENTFDEPRKVSPKTERFAITGNRFTRSFPGSSFTVLRIPTRKQ